MCMFVLKIYGKERLLAKNIQKIYRLEFLFATVSTFKCRITRGQAYVLTPAAGRALKFVT